jgi:hypothetical protein
MLSFEICAQKKGSSIRRTSEFQNSSSRHTPMGSFRALLCSLTQSQTPKGGTGSAWHGSRRQERRRIQARSQPVAHRSNIHNTVLETEGAIGEHEPFDCKPYPKRADTIGPVSAGWARFILSTRFGEIDGLPIGRPDRPDAFISSENMRRNMAKQGHFIELARVNLAG